MLTAIIIAGLELVDLILGLYVWIIIISVLLSWLISFGVVNSYNRFVQTINDICFRLTEPLLVRIRKFIPPINGVDLSPMAVIFAIIFLRSFIRHLSFG